MSRIRSNGQSARDLRTRIAKYLLNLQPGDPLKSVRELAKLFDASIGAISNAIQYLERAGVVRINRRGHLGSFLVTKSLGGLWNIIHDGPLVIAFTISSNLRFEGLATALKMLLGQSSVQTYLIFIRGSSTRIRALREDRCNAVVLSRLSADGECGKNEQVSLELPPQSWLIENRVYIRDGIDSVRGRIKIGVDSDSYDHRFITDLEFKDRSFEKVYANFTQFPRLLLDGQIDATVWNAEDVRFSSAAGIQSRALSAEVREVLRGRDMVATLVTKRNAKSVQAILKNAIDPRILMKIQQRVISGKLLPEY